MPDRAHDRRHLAIRWDCALGVVMHVAAPDVNMRAQRKEVGMIRLICAVMLVLSVATLSLGQQSFVGTYKIVSHENLIDGIPTQNLGKAPRGYLVLTPTRLVVFITGENRKLGTSEADKAALFDTMTGWSGTYRVEGGKIVIAVDASWTEAWTGKNQVRHWTLSGNRLTLTSDPQPYARDPSKTSVSRQVYEKVE